MLVSGWMIGFGFVVVANFIAWWIARHEVNLTVGLASSIMVIEGVIAYYLR